MRACPSLGWSKPHNRRMTVDLPEPFGPRKPKMEPLLDLEADVIHGREVAEPFGQPFALDHRVAGHVDSR